MLIEIFLCKYLWVGKKIGMFSKTRPIYDFLNVYLWRYIALFLMQLNFILYILIKKIYILAPIGITSRVFTLVGISVIPSFIISKYLKKIIKKKHVFYNVEYMQNKWSIPLFIFMILFIFGGGFGIAFLILTY